MSQMSKKEQELSALRLVYPDENDREVRPSECPDFVIAHRHNGLAFGVEITEVFQYESDARLLYLPGYFHELISGSEPHHKDDYRTLKVEKAEIINPDGSVKAREIPCIRRMIPSIDEYRRLLIAAISSKDAKHARYDNQLAHINLILVDHVRPLACNKREHFSSLVLDESIKAAVARSRFREIFLITMIDKANVYVPLVSLCLLSEFYMLCNAIIEYCPDQEPESERGILELFAQFLRARGFAAMVHACEGNTEVLLGNTGLLLSENGVVIHDYRDGPLPKSSPPPKPGDPLWLITESLLIAHARIQQEAVFESPLVFDVHGDPAADTSSCR